MTEEQMKKACAVLLREDDNGNGILSGDLSMLPQVYMVSTEVCLTFFAALRTQKNRWVLWGERNEIETVTINDAWAAEHHGAALPEDIRAKVDWNYNSNGGKKDGEQLLGWQIRRYKNDPRVREFINRVIYPN